MLTLKRSLLMPTLLVAICSVTAAAQAQTQTDELELADRLIVALERENAALKERLDTERAANAVLIELNETRKTESAALREALAAKNETIAAKDEVIDAQDNLIGELKQRTTSIWKRIGDIAIGLLGAFRRKRKKARAHRPGISFNMLCARTNQQRRAKSANIQR